MSKSVLLVIDAQNDFCPGGALGVPEGDQTIPVINRIMEKHDLVVATKDWHPVGHVSFASSHVGRNPGDTVDVGGIEQLLWPDHCIKGGAGAEFHPDLDVRGIQLILHKGSDPTLDSYSAFFENDKKTITGLHGFLQSHGVDTVRLCGLAEDVCVFFSARDAVNLGYSVTVVSDATRGVNIPEGNLQQSREEMKSLGITYARSTELP